ncbi:hypothetical protein I5G58_gp087 [Mycobacterium phage BirdsNest]|uniref:Uncharacterized protein n=1 Tax=Mycobacterium phage BirdsNest TaxID=2686231 RepID=A0A6B9LJ89_9CAUD|nr:hypothetical protein I5G58_gp087 [Mycobacterium phage BirdsNest]QHB37389.1 hypothetical protein PBI_BIRDSNEST_87 [Mycobacterium phage BirdsNest]
MARPGRAKGVSSRSRGTRASGTIKGARRGRSPSMAFGKRGGGHSGTTTPYGKGTPSIKRRDVYDALRREGKSKRVAAKIANAVANGTNGRGIRGPAGGGKRRSRKG